MFSVNDTVVYGTDGVCTVTDITTRAFGKEKAEYYVLTPIHQNGACIYVPTASEALLRKMRRVLSAEEIRQLIADIPQESSHEWITDEAARRTAFKTVLQSGDRRELVRMIKTIYLHGQEQAKNGRKLHHSDEMMMKDAEKLLYDELAYVLGIRPDDILPLLISKSEPAV